MTEKAVRHVSVTELIDFQDCHRKWALRHGLRLVPDQRPANLASGTVVHETIGAALKWIAGGESAERAVYRMSTSAAAALEREFSSHDNPAAQVKKYLPGVLKALGQCPPEIFASDWVIEQPLTINVPTSVGPVEVRGRPDLFRFSEDMSEIELVEIKTTDHDPLDYLLWNPQHRYYALMLQDANPTVVVKFRYLCLPTNGRRKDHAPWIFTTVAATATRQDLRGRTEAWAASDTARALYEPNEASRCKFCDFNPICAAHIAGRSILPGPTTVVDGFPRRPDQRRPDTI